jgi:hypothetical protein
MDYRLYVTINTINGKVYGGKHFYRLPKSLKYKGSGYALQKAFRKYGIDNFKVRWFKLKINTSEDLNRLEIKLIRRLHKKFGRENCYNIHKGGTGAGYTEYMSPEEILEVNKKVSNGLKEMYKDPVKKNNWKESLKKRKSTIRERTKLCGKTEKELRKMQYDKTNGRILINYQIEYPNGQIINESNSLKNFIEKYNTDDFIFRKARMFGSYTFNKVTKLSKHPFPKGTKIYYISEEHTFTNYKNEKTGGSSAPPVSV